MISKSGFSSASRFALTFLMTVGLFSCNREDMMQVQSITFTNVISGKLTLTEGEDFRIRSR